MTGKKVKWAAMIAGLTAVAMSAAYAQSPLDPLPDWVKQLSRVRFHLRQNFERIPSYVCHETVERFQKTGARAVAVKLDSMEFDVAQVEHKELLARPGATGQFEDKDLSAYMRVGLLGTGEFSSLATNLFLSNSARITPHPQGAAPVPNSELGYDFEIPAFLSAFTITARGSRALVGKEGTFWVDAESLDLIRVESHAVDIPLAVGLTEAGSTVDYARMQVGDSNVLLPQSAEQVVTNLDGTQMRNKIQFSGCREYGSESTVHFGDPMEPPPGTKK
jgi:hypothetical protein